jgi:hypothetical protein
MSLLTSLKNTVANRFPQRPVVPEEIGADFTSGLFINEFQWNGTSLELIEGIQLRGTSMPMQPFEWEGEQRIVKEFYPGNIEPSMQVLGPREKNITLKGRFKAKRLKVTPYAEGFEDINTLHGQPYELQEYFDAMRLRGNIIELTLGEWRRYGFIERVKFAMKTLADIDYELEFNIIGVNKPFFNFFANEVQSIPYDINVALAVNGARLSTVDLDPTLPTDVFDNITEWMSDLAEAIAVVTNFVDGVMSIADDVTKLYNRAIGMLLYLRGSIAQYKRRMESLALTISDAPAALAAYDKQGWLMQNSKSLYDMAHVTAQPMNLSSTEQEAALAQLATFAKSRQDLAVDNRGYPSYEQAREVRSSLPLDILVKRMLSQFTALNVVIPKARYSIKEGDTLQKISLKYYGNPLNWYQIQQHNKLEDSDLTSLVGTVIEIPKIDKTDENLTSKVV